jgi:hypothetical protein
MPESIEDYIHINCNNKKDNLLGVLDQVAYVSGDAVDWTRDEIIADLYASFDMKVDTIKEFLDELDMAGVKYSKKYTHYVTRGYSQGDYADVYVLKDNDFEGMQQHIDHLFWDSPISGRVTIKNTEWYLYDLIDNEYDMSINDVKEQVINAIKREYKHAPALHNIVASVEDSFPSEIKYNISNENKIQNISSLISGLLRYVLGRHG